MDDFKTFLRINPYPHYLGIAFNMDMRTAILGEAGVEPSDIEVREYGAVTEFYRNGTQAAALCVVTFFQEGEIPAWTMAHEAIHVADDVMERCGIHFDTRNDEPYAYLIEWIVRMMVFAQDAWNNRDSHKGAYFTDIIRTRMRMAQNERSEELNVTAPFPDASPASATFREAIKEGVNKAKGVQEGIEHGYLLKLPDELHYDTRKLVMNVAREMGDKLLKAQQKYGYGADWRKPTYTPSEWAQDVIHHLGKGDPLDIINYMAFARDRKWSTALITEGFAAIHAQQDGDKLCLQVLNKADLLLDAKAHEAQFDEDTANRQYESLSCANALNMTPEERQKWLNGEFTPNNPEPCCPACRHPRINYTAKTDEYRFYCKGCGHKFDEYALRER